MTTEYDSPVDRSAGTSGRAEKKWGVIGGVTGALVGCGSALVAVVLDGAPLYEPGLYPRVFESRELLALDVYLLVVLLAGAGFSTAALVLARRSPYPRTETYGAGLTGLILLTLSGSLLFLRLAALLRAV